MTSSDVEYLALSGLLTLVKRLYTADEDPSILYVRIIVISLFRISGSSIYVVFTQRQIRKVKR